MHNQSPGAPNPYSPPEQPPGGGGGARGALTAPAFGLMAVGALSILCNLASIALNALGTGFATLGSSEGQAGIGTVLHGAVGMGMSAFFILASAAIIFGAMKMRNLQNYNLAVATSVLAMLPCTTYACCLLGLPFGIWGLVVLMKPDVKAAFR